MLLVPPRRKNVAPIVEPTRSTLVKAARGGAHHTVAAAGQNIGPRRLATHGCAAVVQHGVAHGDLNVLTAAGRDALIEGGENAHGAEHAGSRISNRGAGPDGWTIGVTIHTHGPTHGLGD